MVDKFFQLAWINVTLLFNGLVRVVELHIFDLNINSGLLYFHL